MNLFPALSVCVAAWLSFGLAHSLLATISVRQRMQTWLGPAERLAFNLVAVVHLAAVLAISAFVFAGQAAFHLPLWFRITLHLVQMIGFVFLLAALREYDLGLFSGVRQWRTGVAENLKGISEHLVVVGLHKFVRHPLYAASILLLFASATTPLGLVTASCATLYFMIGLKFEERKLLRLYGEEYRAYRAATPALLPRWRLSVAPAR